MSARVCIAQIGAPHGVRGEVRLKSFTAEPEAVANYGPLETEDGARSLQIVALRPGKGVLIARFRGVEERDAAERLRNARLFVPRERLGAAEEEEFFHADLIGLHAVDRSGAELGRVIAVQNYGAGDLIEIAPANGGPSVFAPFTKAVVPAVDLAAGKIVLEAPAGLFS